MPKILNQLVSDYISVDEYEPKSGMENEVVVVVIYVNDQPPANELGDFLEKSYVDIIDVEVSENPDTNGFYPVFVEVERVPSFFSNLFKLMKEVEVLAGKKDWMVKPYLSTDTFSLYSPELQEYIQTDKDSYLTKTEFLEMKATEDDVVNFMENAANISKYVKSNNKLTFIDSAYGVNTTYKIVETGTGSINETTSYLSSISLQKLKYYFGPQYNLYETDTGIIVSKENRYIKLI